MMQYAVVFRQIGAMLVLALGLGLNLQAQAQAQSTPAAKKPAAAASRPTPAAATPAASEQEVDGIVAVVNKDVITQRELDARVRQAKIELKMQKVNLPPDEVLQRDLLQRMIMERLQAQESARQKVVVTDKMVDQAIEVIAQRNKTSIAQMRKQVEAGGMPWEDYKKMLRGELALERLRQRVVDSTILVTDAEVDAYLRDQKARQSGGGGGLTRAIAPDAAPQQPQQAAIPSQPAVMGLAQILIRIPEGSSPEQVAALRARAEAILARLKRGEKFEVLAATSSEGPEASRGGDMGGRPMEAWPDLFLNAVSGLQDGQVSNVIQSGNGFHILKVLGRAGGNAPAPASKTQAPAAPQPAQGQSRSGIVAPQGPMPVQQTKARHILIKTSEVVTDDVAKQKMMQIRDRIVSGGEPFSDMAKRFSNDGSAPSGGDLGWLNPGETVPPFEKAMNALKIGQISEPVKTQFGWHLIVVDDRRTEDMAEQFMRNQVRQKLFQQRSEAAFELWLQTVRNQSYIDNRLEKRQRQSKE